MVRYILRRLAAFVALGIGIVIIAFGLMHIVPGDPAVVLLGQNATPEATAELRTQLGLDAPLAIQLGRYIAGLTRGDLGRSIFQDRPVSVVVASRFPATIELALSALVLAIIIGGALGVVSAIRPGSMADRISGFIAYLGVSMPVFWLGILLMAVISVRLHWLPAVGRGTPLVSSLGALLLGRVSPLVDSLSHLLLPALTLSAASAAVISRLMRASLIEALNEPFVRAARARGLSETVVLVRYALGNALIPVVNIVGLRFGTLLGGAVLTESIFGWPGMGQLAVSAISQRDLPLVQGVVLVFALSFAVLNLGVDLLTGLLDPRIQESRGRSIA